MYKVILQYPLFLRFKVYFYLSTAFHTLNLKYIPIHPTLYTIHFQFTIQSAREFPFRQQPPVQGNQLRQAWQDDRAEAP